MRSAARGPAHVRPAFVASIVVLLAVVPGAAALATHRTSVRAWSAANRGERARLRPDPTNLRSLALAGGGDEQPSFDVEVAPDLPSTPTVSEVSPSQGSTEGGSTLDIVPGHGGGVSVSVKGEHLMDATRVDFGSWEAAAFRVVSEGELAVVPPAREAGTVDVTVTSEAGTSAKSAADHYTYGPVVESVTPQTGAVGGQTKIVITGKGLEGVSTVEFPVVGSPCAGFNPEPASAEAVTQLSATEVEAVTPETGLCSTLKESPVPGPADVTVGGSLGQSAISTSDRFSFGPAVERLEPNEGPTAGGTLIKITGRGFVPNATEDEVKVGGTKASEVHYVSSEELEAKTPAHAAASAPVRVTTPAGTSPTTESARYFFGPAVTGLAPYAGELTGGDVVTITGHGFVANVAEDEVKFGEERANNMTFKSPTELTARAPAAGEGKPAAVAVTVTTKEGKSGATATGLYAYGLPYIEKLEPARPFEPIEATTQIAPGSPLDIDHSGAGKIRIRGRNFGSLKEVLFPTGGHQVASPHFEVNPEGTEITATTPVVEETTNELGGTGHLSLVTPVGASPGSAFDLFRFTAGPQVTQVNAGEGSTAGGETVTIKGWNFIRGLTEVKFGATPAAHTVVKSHTESYSSSTQTEIIATSPKHSAGIVDVTVTTPEGTSPVSGADRFTYHGFGIEPGGFEVTACSEEEAEITLPLCGYFGPESLFFTQAAGEPPYLVISLGVTASEINQKAPGFTPFRRGFSRIFGWICRRG